MVVEVFYVAWFTLAVCLRRSCLMCFTWLWQQKPLTLDNPLLNLQEKKNVRWEIMAVVDNNAIVNSTWLQCDCSQDASFYNSSEPHTYFQKEFLFTSQKVCHLLTLIKIPRPRPVCYWRQASLFLFLWRWGRILRASKWSAYAYLLAQAGRTVPHNPSTHLAATVSRLGKNIVFPFKTLWISSRGRLWTFKKDQDRFDYNLRPKKKHAKLRILVLFRKISILYCVVLLIFILKSKQYTKVTVTFFPNEIKPKIKKKRKTYTEKNYKFMSFYL